MSAEAFDPNLSLCATAVVLERPESLVVKTLDLIPPGAEDAVVDIHYSGISTGTERLLWMGRMPSFPGMGYPLVPGYESVGKVVWAGADSGRCVDEFVFVPGARCYGEVNGLFGGAASRVVVPGVRLVPISESLGEQAVLLALAATAYHAVFHLSEDLGKALVVGHGVLGRLLARIIVAKKGPHSVTVWERNPERASGALGYTVLDPDADDCKQYKTILDVSGDSTILDTLIAHLAPQGEVVLAGFYSQPLSFHFPPAFMREARLRVAAEWRETDIQAVKQLLAEETLSLEGLITHRMPIAKADRAYRTAFGDPACLKMILDWRSM